MSFLSFVFFKTYVHKIAFLSNPYVLLNMNEELWKYIGYLIDVGYKSDVNSKIGEKMNVMKNLPNKAQMVKPTRIAEQ